MPNVNDKVFDRLFGENIPELMPHELERLLDAELAKSAEEMDTELIHELLNLLVEDEPTAAEMEADWQAISRKLSKRRHRQVLLRRTAIAAASIVGLFFISFASARALNWTQLLKFLMPVAQTFGIVSPDIEGSNGQTSEYWSEDSEDMREIEFSSLDDIPGEIGKAIVGSNCIPEGYEFIQGIWADDGIIQKYYLTFVKGEKWISLEALEFSQGEDPTIDFEFERQESVPDNWTIDGIDVTVYLNSDGECTNASWLLGSVHYNLYGTLSNSEIEQIVHILNAYQ